MTDNEIIKALECCNKARNYAECERLKCPLYMECRLEYKALEEALLPKVIDLINRQKAELERLTGKRNADPMDFCGVLCRYSEELITKAKAEARKEFAERVKKTICANTCPYFDKDGKPVNIWNAKTGYDDIDNLVKEMVGEDNDKT